MLFFIRDLLRLVDQELGREIDRRDGLLDYRATEVSGVRDIVRAALAQLERVKA